MTNFTATEILKTKVNFEVLMRTYGYIVLDYHSDNGVFNSRLLQQHLQNGEQTLTLSGVGAQFQDGVAERNIGTIIGMARTMLLHAMLRWNAVTLSLRPFAVEYSCKIHNILPKGDGPPSAIEMLTKSKITSNHYKDIHVFGALTYVLAPALQNGHKLPKWDARSKQDIFLGHSRMKKNLIARGFKPSEFDPCLFISKKVIVLVYVDDCLFFSHKQEYIDEVIASLQKDMTLTIEGNDVTKFLGIDYSRLNDGSYCLKQPGLTQKIIDTVNMSRCKPEPTPASEVPLAAHPDFPPFSEPYHGVTPLLLEC